ncbi:D-3-phosphoglycerate dehydrogenase [Plectosphaerella cucumerina]|uniref:D-3-phosphoglycerate dehydrogenase n=1 Tax=Plectosphaerella cucumerina TaxID=40658 RepID=A0A8K0TLJ6_9PEZI|nr:D-3-phosphoglycerate dehydrogenase [Plectosphaerella cucumerina]
MGSLASSNPLSNDVVLIVVPAQANQEWIDRVKAKYPGITVRWEYLAIGGPKTTEDLPADIWDGVTIYSGFVTGPSAGMDKVRFIQLPSAGADRWLDHHLYKNRPDVVFSTANGVHPPQIAEWVIATWLNNQHHLLRYHGFQQQATWKRLSDPVDDSVGLRMGVLGYGAIGRQCGRLGQALGMEVYAYTRGERSTPVSRRDDSYCVPGTGDPDGLIPSKWFHGASRESIDHFLAQDLDLLVIGLPLTPETDGLFGREQFEILSKRKTFVSNIARGRLIQQDALIEAVESGKIRGAALDVTEPEPLPDGHPLWTAPNVYITPHISGITTKYWDRALDILETNIDHLAKGEPLINVIDRKLNY